MEGSKRGDRIRAKVDERLKRFEPTEPIFIKQLEDIQEKDSDRQLICVYLRKLIWKKELGTCGRGIYYKPKKTEFGTLGIDRQEVIKRLYIRRWQDGVRIGYVTGPNMWNTWGLTTQVPNIITIAQNVKAEAWKHPRVHIVVAVAPIRENNNFALAFLDTLRSIEYVQGSGLKQSMKTMAYIYHNKLLDLDRDMMGYALKYYPDIVKQRHKEILKANGY